VLLDSTFINDLVRADEGAVDTLDDPRVLTRNVDEFERVDAIGVVTY